MIRKQDILDRSGEWQLRPEIVEKDYVLGWLLWGLGRHPMVASTWVFKGGTCLKKCYFETYRFSGDLDFTLTPDAPYTRDEILTILRDIARNVSSESGIEIPEDAMQVDDRRDKQGRPTFRARLGYRGPLAFPGVPRILFDLTSHEPVLGEPKEVPIFHPYPDTLPEPASIHAYGLEELLAEKTRALFERTRPRDLYDVVYVVNNQATNIDLSRTRELFIQKCQAKSVAPPASAILVAHIRKTDELRSEWKNMLGHQLPQLPPVDSLLSEIDRVLQWIDLPVGVARPALPPAPMGTLETRVAPAGIQYWGGGVGLEAIRFAGANRLLVRFTYDGKERLVEPYSLRQASTGNLLLYAREVGSTVPIKAFITAKIIGVRPTDTPFTPLYQVEFTSGGFAPILPTASPVRRANPFSVHSLGAPSRRRRHSLGSTYVFACPFCSKEFRRSKNDPTLRTHKAPGGWACAGRRGYLVRMS
jgi:predicted nucleotidyltransferase component of viral defense system